MWFEAGDLRHQFLDGSSLDVGRVRDHQIKRTAQSILPAGCMPVVSHQPHPASDAVFSLPLLAMNARAAGVSSHLLDDAGGLDPAWLEGKTRVALTADRSVIGPCPGTTTSAPQAIIWSQAFTQLETGPSQTIGWASAKMMSPV